MLRHFWKFAIGLICFLVIDSSLVAKSSIAGFWRSISEKTGQTQCIVAIYEYQDMYYGRIIGTCDANGKINDTMYAPKGRAPGVVGNPPYAGLDLLWDLRKKGSRYKGKIIDPEKGKIYDAKVWAEGGNLIIRGELLFFGRNITWFPALESDFSETFQKPDVSQFVPIVPLVY